jgi:lipocalin
MVLYHRCERRCVENVCDDKVGMWILTRDAHPSDELMTEILKIATDDLGLDTSVLNKVEHS